MSDSHLTIVSNADKPADQTADTKESAMTDTPEETNAPKKKTSTTTIHEVMSFLRDNPSFLEENPQAVDLLIPQKKRGKRGEAADFQAYAIERIKSDRDDVLETTKDFIANSRANMNNQQRIHKAVLRWKAKTFFYKITSAALKPFMAAARRSYNHKYCCASAYRSIHRPQSLPSVAVIQICSLKGKPPTKSSSSPA